LSHQQKGNFADVAVTFSLPHQQKSKHRGVKQNFQHCKRYSQKKKIVGVKQNIPTLQGSKGPFTFSFFIKLLYC
jgi:uncharacterized protein YeaC (DUF1315 family)